ncbi:MAG: hypothetical protein QOD57_2150 [Actinomycetota bacterium]|nr:hypothetical protein [Actinomycetota bacterium]
MRSHHGLAGVLFAAGDTHMVRPEFYDPIVPRALPGAARVWTYGSGLAELGVAAALLVPALRRPAALAAAVLFVAVFPANLQMALDGGYPDASGILGSPALAWARLPLQVPLVWWSLTLARKEPAP